MVKKPMTVDEAIAIADKIPTAHLSHEQREALQYVIMAATWMSHEGPRDYPSPSDDELDRWAHNITHS